MSPSTLPNFVITQAKVQTVAALGLGLALLTAPNLVHNNPITNHLASFLHPAGMASITSPATDQLSALSGIFCTAIGMAYAMSFYHGYDEWLYMTIPGRLLVSGLCLATWVLAPEKMSPLLLVIMVWDGGNAAIGGYLMGDWSGRKPGRRGADRDE